MLLEAIIPVADYFSFQTIMIATTTILLASLLVYLVGGFANNPDVSLQKSWENLSSNSSLKKSWQDLAPPFNQESPSQEEWNHTDQDVTHFCFLVHGHRGLSKVG